MSGLFSLTQIAMGCFFLWIGLSRAETGGGKILVMCGVLQVAMGVSGLNGGK